MPTSSDLGVIVESIPVYPQGPQLAPAVINDNARGTVRFLSSETGFLSNIFLADFDMKAGQVRGRAAHNLGDVAFFLLEGSYVFLTASKDFNAVTTERIDSPARIHIPEGKSHVFIPLTDGKIIEYSNTSHRPFLDSITRQFNEFAPHIERVQKEIAAGKFDAPAVAQA